MTNPNVPSSDTPNPPCRLVEAGLQSIKARVLNAELPQVGPCLHKVGTASCAAEIILRASRIPEAGGWQIPSLQPGQDCLEQVAQEIDKNRRLLAWLDGDEEAFTVELPPVTLRPEDLPGQGPTPSHGDPNSGGPVQA